jgi:hypothetical protein
MSDVTMIRIRKEDGAEHRSGGSGEMISNQTPAPHRPRLSIRKRQRGVVEALQCMHERLRAAVSLARRLKRHVQLLRQRQARQRQLHRLTLC